MNGFLPPGQPSPRGVRSQASQSRFARCVASLSSRSPRHCRAHKTCVACHQDQDQWLPFLQSTRCLFHAAPTLINALPPQQRRSLPSHLVLIGLTTPDLGYRRTEIGRVGNRRGDRRIEGVAVVRRLSPKCRCLSLVQSSVSVPAPRTGRADFPHPALISEIHTFAFDKSSRRVGRVMRPSFSYRYSSGYWTRSTPEESSDGSGISSRS
jgi:hypothetical protein